MYLIRPNIIEGNITGYWCDEKIQGKLIESHFVTLHPRACSCRHFTESRNVFGHFHIALVEHYLKNGSPIAAIYGKSKDGKIETLCPGFTKKN
jgi:hypothetical protein